MDYRCDKRNMLWYRQSAKTWNEALPIGNGRIGAMMFGGVKTERVALNEDTLWSGYPRNKNNADAHKYYAEAQQLVREGKLNEAQLLIEDHMEGEFSECYLPLGDLTVDFDIVGDVTGYKRMLDMRSGLNICEFDLDGAHYTRTAFISYPDQVMVMRIESSAPGTVAFNAHFESQLRYTAYAQGNAIIADLRAPSRALPSYVNDENAVWYSDVPNQMGIRCRTVISVNVDGGFVKTENGEISVANADSATIVIAARTSFNGADKQPETEGRDEKADVQRDVYAIKGMDYEKLLDRHLSDFVPLYDRVRFELDDEKDDLPTDERLRRFRDEQNDSLLYEQIFNYGRYLTFAASRPGTLATNLQGIWNPHLRAPWSSNYTININTEMNYWPAEICAMGDMAQPLIDFIQSLRKPGAQTAQDEYGAEGVVSHHNSDIWAMSNPVGNGQRDSAVWAFWPMSFGWLCRSLVDHYDFNPDDDLLRNTVIPTLEDCARFYLSVLMENKDGQLVITPMTSPENNFIYDGQKCAVARSGAMACAIVYETFENLVRLCEKAGIKDDVLLRVTKALPRLKQFDIGSCGQLLEWDSEYEEAEPHHRHTSHLYALHPAHLITPEAGRASAADCPEEYRSPIPNQADLANACRQTLNMRGDDGTGWSLGWKINHWARLMDGDHAVKLIKRQLRLVEENGYDYLSGGGTYPNMFDAHPPFQIDGNFGTCAGIAEMFCQGYRGNLLLLPALPTEWKSGRMHGLRAPNGLTVDIDFENGKLKLARIYARNALARPLRVVYADKVKYISLTAGDMCELRERDFAK